MVKGAKMASGRKTTQKKRANTSKRVSRDSVKAARKKAEVRKPQAPVKHIMSKVERAEARAALKLKTQKAAMKQKEKESAIHAEGERQKVEVLLANTLFSEFISRNVGKKAINIIRMLNIPQTDEKLAADLNIKINEVRRILNVLDTYGVARYDTNKDSKGWLTFRWYLNTGKLTDLSLEIASKKDGTAFKLQDDCNDFFYCNACYDDQKVILPFDAAFENQFKCDNCGKGLKQLSKTEAQKLFSESFQEQQAEIV
jgi:transcription factor E